VFDGDTVRLEREGSEEFWSVAPAASSGKVRGWPLMMRSIQGTGTGYRVQGTGCRVWCRVLGAGCSEQ